MKVEELLSQIEDMRLALCVFALGKHLTDPEVVELSQKLDRLLNEFHKMCLLDKDKG